ncbi:hypothetical protein [Ferruginibacter albus]|uniref:hypothetical protein n=1 Tax=Ferruginibacter albus TaxID=2875540 RepID=UPI001CC756C6|nr:hypothetical protein [Ferruginibacter albus]UAY52587.1 hypothetical protein K9M53_02585 [Ferruginibacter albus]
MNRLFSTMLLVTLVFCTVQAAITDRGSGKKNKKKSATAALNITTTTSLRNSILFNLKSGLKYKGSFLTGTQTIGSSIIENSIVTYQKGNTTYIIPYKHKILMPESSKGYTGFKLVIQPK